MAHKFLNFLRRSNKSSTPSAKDSLLNAIESDLVEKQKENKAQQERVEDAIRRGTRVAKRRIPL
jgi:hypothetical protein